jgi:S1-C subfamily serine protease
MTWLRSSVMLCLSVMSLQVAAQKKAKPQSMPTGQSVEKMPVATKWTFEATPPTERNGVTMVVLLLCPQTSMKGTGFVINGGIIVTNAHVMAGCTPTQMIGLTTFGTPVSFSNAVVDSNVDLALMKPVQSLGDGLELADADDLQVGSPVYTWGFPLQFNGPAPLLSVGVLSGFMQDGMGATKVKHLVIDGAINPGNSGGPLFLAGTSKVVGIVVAKFIPYTPAVQQIIAAMAKNNSGFMYTSTQPDGSTKSFSEGQLVADVLQEYYNGTQVMIGEAIHVSELKTLLANHAKELSVPPVVQSIAAH